MCPPLHVFGFARTYSVFPDTISFSQMLSILLFLLLCWNVFAMPASYIDFFSRTPGLSQIIPKHAVGF